jgi:hypothetical protein
MHMSGQLHIMFDLLAAPIFCNEKYRYNLIQPCDLPGYELSTIGMCLHTNTLFLVTKARDVI